MLKKWFVSKREHDAFVKKAETLLKERDEALEKLEKYQEWEDNPMAVLKHFVPSLDISATDPLSLSHEERETYLMDAYDIYNKFPFHNEMNRLMKSFTQTIVETIGNEKKADNTRQLYFLVEGIKTTFQSYAKQFENLHKKKQPAAPGTVIPT